MGDSVRTNEKLVIDIAKELKETKLTVHTKAYKLIDMIVAKQEDICELDFENVELINSSFLKPLANFIINSTEKKITLVGLDKYQKDLVREIFISERRL